MASAPESTAAKQKIVEVRPTVFVALGGTGMEILMRLRRRILQADWGGQRLNSISEFPVAGFLYFDTDLNEARESGRATAVDPMAKAIAFGKGETLQAKVNVGYYQQNKENYPAIAEWLPSRDLSRIDTDKGAGQIRAISRLLFFDQFETFKAMVARKGTAVTANVSNQDELKRLGIEKVQKELRVVVVCSAAGGTGSGAFIDVGMAIRSMMSPAADKVELFMMLPSGYAGANRDRVFANGFAALSELEHVMRPNSQPPYVTRWTSQERVAPGGERPFHEVYFFDTRNIARDVTEHVGDIYDMIADILFEDFGSGEFASRKRSISVNQQQFKTSLWHPALGGDDRRQSGLAFAKNYSAVGQSTIATTGSLELEAAVSDASRTMLQAFFGVAEQSAAREPNVKDRDAFLRGKLFLAPRMVDDYPEFLSPRPPAVPIYQLVDQLLVSNDGKSIHGRLIEDLAGVFRAMREQASEPKDWATQAEKIRARYESEVLSQAGSASIRKAELEGARARLLRQLGAESGPQSLRQALFDLVDDRENGGLDFTIALVQQIRTELAKDQTGIRAQLEHAASQLRAVADDIMSRHLIGSLQRLETAARPRFIGGVDRRAAEEFLKQVETDLGEGLKYWLHSQAAQEAILLLEEVATHLGEQSAPDEQGNVTWTGLLRELDEGRRSVRAVMQMVSDEARRVRDAVNRPDNGVYIVIDRGGGRIAEERVTVEPRAWAAEKFDQFGGCRKLFPQLRNDDERLHLINQLRAIAKEKLANEERTIPTATAALVSLPIEERKKVVERLLARSMPWFPAKFDRFKPDGQQFKLIIAAPEASRYRGELLELVKANAPGFGMELPTIEESSVPGRIICYCELSGIPLDAIAPLGDDWRKSYEKQLGMPDPLPLHNHWDFLRFPNPVVPSNEEIQAQLETLRLFIKGVMYGVLRRGMMSEPGANSDARYYLDMSYNDFHAVGTERKIRIKGFEANHLKRLSARIDEVEAGFSALQWAAAAALAKWTAARAYTPIREVDEASEAERQYAGLGNQVANELAEQLRRRAQTAPDAKALKLSAADIQQYLQPKVEGFTLPVSGSVDDLDDSEVNKSRGSLEFRATDKRMLDSTRFTDIELMALLPVQAGPAGTASSAPSGGDPPEPAPTPAPGAAAVPISIEELTAKLTELRKLVDAGLLTADDLEKAKSALMARL